MPPLAIHEPPLPATAEEWAEVVEEMNREDDARNRRVNKHEVTETDLGVPLTALREAKRRPPSEPKDPYELWPHHYDDGRWHFPNVIGMTGGWFGPVRYWADYRDEAAPVVHVLDDMPCEGCGGAWLSAGTICGQCDRSGKDYRIPAVTPAERARDKTKYVPTKGVKGGTG